MNRWQRILAVMEKEILHIFRDKIMFMIAFVAPFLLAGLVGFLYLQQSVTHVPIAVYDQDQSEISRTIIRSFMDSEKFTVVSNVNSYAEIQKAIQTKKAFMGVVIPPQLKKNIELGRSTEVGLILNGTNILIMNTVANAANQIIQTISAGITIRVMEGYGIPKQRAYQAVTAINFRTRIWYNPTTSYTVFMLVGLFGTIIQQVTFLGVALAFSKEQENGTWRQLAFSKLSEAEMMMGKLLVYFLIYCLDSLVIYGFGIAYFNLPMRGNPLLLLLTIMIFIFVLLAIGMVISTVTTSSSQAIEVSMLIAVPSFLISGYTWPSFSMFWPIKFLSQMLPLTHFLEVTQSIVLMGSGLSVVWYELSILTLFGVICFPLATFFLQRKMQRY